MKYKQLSRKYLPDVSRWFRQFAKVIYDGNEDYAFYRGEIYEDATDSNLIHLNLLVSDEEGRLNTRDVIYDTVHSIIYYCKGFYFSNEKEFMAAFDTLLERLCNLPPIARLYFDFGSRILNTMVYDSKKSKGSYIIFLICNINSELCLSDSSLPGLITKDWSAVREIWY